MCEYFKQSFGSVKLPIKCTCSIKHSSDHILESEALLMNLPALILSIIGNIQIEPHQNNLDSPGKVWRIRNSGIKCVLKKCVRQAPSQNIEHFEARQGWGWAMVENATKKFEMCLINELFLTCDKWMVLAWFLTLDP